MYPEKTLSSDCDKKMNFKTPAYIFPTTFCLAILAGCQTTEPDMISTLDTPKEISNVNFPIRSFDKSTAATLILNNKEAFQSAISLVAQRPEVLREISKIEVGITSLHHEGELRSSIEFSPLPYGLNYARQITGESVNMSIDSFGVGSVLYWMHNNPHIPNENWHPNTAPSALRLIKGELYSAHAAFILESTTPTGEISTENCTPTERVSASTIHEKLSGLATKFRCERLVSKMRFDGEIWYFEDYARYLPHIHLEDEDEGEGETVGSRFTVKNVEF